MVIINSGRICSPNSSGKSIFPKQLREKYFPKQLGEKHLSPNCLALVMLYRLNPHTRGSSQVLTFQLSTSSRQTTEYLHGGHREPQNERSKFKPWDILQGPGVEDLLPLRGGGNSSCMLNCLNPKRKPHGGLSKLWSLFGSLL